jgi:outer membrane protein TolC
MKNPGIQIFLITVVIATSVATAVRAQISEIRLASVGEAISYAQHFGPELDEYALRCERANRQYNSVRYHWLPSLSATVSAKWNGALPLTPIPGEIVGRPGQTLDVEFGKTYAYTPALTLSQPVFDLQAWYVAASAEEATKSAKASLAAYRQHLSEQVALQYYTAIITEALLRSQRESQTDAAMLVSLAASRFEQGIADQSAVNRALMNQNTVRLDEAHYRDVLEQSYANLRILLGIPPGTDFILGEIPTLELHKPAFPEELGPDRGLVVDELAVSQAHYRLREKQSSRWPKIMIDGYLGVQQLQDDMQLSFESATWPESHWVALTLSVPLFTGFSRRNQILAEEAAYKLTLKSYSRKKDEARTINANLVTRRELYRKQLSTTRKNNELARESASLTLQKYEQGVVDLEQYLNARENQRQAEAAYGNALLSYYRLVATFISRRPSYE